MREAKEHGVWPKTRSTLRRMDSAPREITVKMVYNIPQKLGSGALGVRHSNHRGGGGGGGGLSFHPGARMPDAGLARNPPRILRERGDATTVGNEAYGMEMPPSSQQG